MVDVARLIPIFCCETSRNHALRKLSNRFPQVPMRINTGFTGETGIEITAGTETIDKVKDYITSTMTGTFRRFI